MIRFALGDAAGYETAFEILRQAGFQPHRTVDSPPACAVLPGAVVADVFQDPAVIARVVFEAFAEARLRPVAVTGCEVALPRARPPLARP